MDLTKAKIFLFAVDSGSLSKAAFAFNYTPSGISHMMSAFEAEIGFSLLIRTKTGVFPTPNAKKIIPIIRAQCQWNESLVQMSSQIKGLNVGNLTIAAYASIASQWLPKIINEFHKDYPAIVINVLDGVWQEVENNLAERKADIGFYSYQPSIKHQWVPLRKDDMVLAVPLTHPLAQYESVKLSDVPRDQLIVPAYGSDIDVLNLLSEEHLASDKEQFHISTLENASAMSMVELGLGVVISNRLITQRMKYKVKLLPFDPPRYITLGMAVRAESKLTPAVVKFVEYTRNIISTI